MTSATVTALWYLDRGTALVALPALWVAVLTGIFYRTRKPRTLHALANDYHLEASAFALVVSGMHAVVGTLDAVALGAGLAPTPRYPWWLFVAGVVVGALSLVTILIAVASFLAPWRFDNPSLVHALAYLGFVFGVVHAVAIGTDVVGVTEQIVLTSLFVILVALVVKLAVGVGAGVKRIARRIAG